MQSQLLFTRRTLEKITSGTQLGGNVCAKCLGIQCDSLAQLCLCVTVFEHL